MLWGVRLPDRERIILSSRNSSPIRTLPSATEFHSFNGAQPHSRTLTAGRGISPHPEELDLNNTNLTYEKVKWNLNYFFNVKWICESLAFQPVGADSHIDFNRNIQVD